MTSSSSDRIKMQGLGLFWGRGNFCQALQYRVTFTNSSNFTVQKKKAGCKSGPEVVSTPLDFISRSGNVDCSPDPDDPTVGHLEMFAGA